MRIEEKKNNNNYIKIFAIGLLLILVGGVGLNLLFVISCLKISLSGGIASILISLIIWGIISIAIALTIYASQI